MSEIKENNVYLGDSYELIKSIKDKSIDCIYTDVPYLYDDHGEANEQKSDVAKRVNRLQRELKNQKIVKGIDYTILDEFIRVMKKINIFIWCSKKQILDIMKYFIEQHNCFFEILVWCKTNPTPQCNNSWLPDIEYCLYFKEGGVLYNKGYKLKSKYYISTTNVLDKADYNHPTIKPLDLVKRHILHTTQPKDIILDPFMGSGTTCIACKETDRKYIGIEISEQWYKVAKDRLEGFNQKGEMNIFDI